MGVLLSDTALAPDVAAAVDGLFEEAVRRQGLPGLAVAVVQGGTTAYGRCHGLADANSRTLVTSGTVFRVASISKTFTALAVMQLWEQGRVGLDDAANDHLRSLRIETPVGSPPATVRHLLTHTAGIGEVPRPADLLRPVAWGLAVRGRPAPAPADVYGDRLAAEVAPGTKWAYANHGFAALGQLVTDVSDQPFAEVVRTRVFNPLGMRHSDFSRSDRVADNLATGYARRGGLPRSVPYRDFLEGSGNALASVTDMTRFLSALLGGGTNTWGGAVRPDTLALMFTPQYQQAPGFPALGLGFWLHTVGSHRAVAHSGSLPGFVSRFVVAPDDGWGVVVLANQSSLLDMGPYYAVETLAEGVLRTVLGAPDPLGDLPPKGVLAQPHGWHELVGVYRPERGALTNARVWMMLGGEVKVRARGGRLEARSPWGTARRGAVLHAVDQVNPYRFRADLDGRPLEMAFERNTFDEVETLHTASTTGLYTLRKRPGARGVRWWSSAAAVALAAAVLLRRRRMRA